VIVLLENLIFILERSEFLVVGSPHIRDEEVVSLKSLFTIYLKNVFEIKGLLIAKVFLVNFYAFSGLDSKLARIIENEFMLLEHL
jgi:hypothetical protein